VPRSGHFVRLDTGLQTAWAFWLGASSNGVLDDRFYLLVCVSQKRKIRVHRDHDWTLLSCVSGAERLELITAWVEFKWCRHLIKTDGDFSDSGVMGRVSPNDAILRIKKTRFVGQPVVETVRIADG
jgi:hypothetical protein